MDDDEQLAVSYQGVTPGVPVLTRDGTQFGILEHVLEVPEKDVFDGIVVWTGGGGWLDRRIQRDLSRGAESAAPAPLCPDKRVPQRASRTIPARDETHLPIARGSTGSAAARRAHIVLTGIRMVRARSAAAIELDRERPGTRVMPGSEGERLGDWLVRGVRVPGWHLPGERAGLGGRQIRSLWIHGPEAVVVRARRARLDVRGTRRRRCGIPPSAARVCSYPAGGGPGPRG